MTPSYKLMDLWCILLYFILLLYRIVGELVVSVITELCIAYTVFYIAVFGYAYMLGILCQRDV